MASNPATEIASIIQSASIKRHPDPAHDINPSTAASRKIPAEIVSPARSRSNSLTSETSTLPSDIIRPRPRTREFPPIPDFRFEQSYLASIKDADTKWQVAFITIRDQVVLPLTQGVLWNLAMFGWRHWNRGSKFQGTSLGARVRKWWWGVNNWSVPAQQQAKESAEKVEEFVVDHFGASLGD